MLLSGFVVGTVRFNTVRKVKALFGKVSRWIPADTIFSAPLSYRLHFQKREKAAKIGRSKVNGDDTWG